MPDFWGDLTQQPLYTHATPLYSDVIYGIRHISILMHHSASNRWHGHLVKLAAKGVAQTGNLFNLWFSSFEGTALAAIGFIGAFTYGLTNGRSEIIHRYTIKCFAISFNSYISSLISLKHLFKNEFISTHANNIITDQIGYVGGAILAQLVVGRMLFLTSRTPHNGLEGTLNDRILRIGYFLVQHFNVAMQLNLTSAILRDIEQTYPLIRAQVPAEPIPQRNREHLEPGRIETFFSVFPQHLEMVRQFDLNHLRNEDYRQQISQVAVELANFCDVVAIPVYQQPGLFYFNANHRDTGYKNLLTTIIKNALIELYDHPRWILCCGETQEEGQEALKGSFPEIYVPLVNFAQLRELEGDLSCPHHFVSQELQGYNNRREKLRAAKASLAQLTPLAKEFLIYKLLLKENLFERVAELTDEEIAQVHLLFLKVAELAGGLLRGKLMSQEFFNLEGPNFLQSNNLFQKACQDAIRAIDNRGL
ncbi:MAG: hypothetical protein H0V82_06890 [Candidatus Protochlamydia sp.]|nr:hypothetical protein [Candidatus Protochlamydia sp.]